MEAQMVTVTYKTEEGLKVGSESVLRKNIPSVGDRKTFNKKGYKVTRIGDEHVHGKLTVYVKEG